MMTIKVLDIVNVVLDPESTTQEVVESIAKATQCAIYAAAEQGDDLPRALVVEVLSYLLTQTHDVIAAAAARAALRELS